MGSWKIENACEIQIKLFGHRTTFYSPTLTSEIFFTLFECLEDKSLINFHVFLGFNIIGFRFLMKYFCLAVYWPLLNIDTAICAFRKVSGPDQNSMPFPCILSSLK